MKLSAVEYLVLSGIRSNPGISVTQCIAALGGVLDEEQAHLAIGKLLDKGSIEKSIDGEAYFITNVGTSELEDTEQRLEERLSRDLYIA